MVFWYACACSVLVGWVLSTGRSWDFMIQGNGFMISLVAGTVVQELLEVAILWRKSAYRTDRLIHKGRNPPNQSHLGQLLWFGSKWSFRHLQRSSISLSDDWHERVCFNLFSYLDQGRYLLPLELWTITTTIFFLIARLCKSHGYVTVKFNPPCITCWSQHLITFGSEP